MTKAEWDAMFQPAKDGLVLSKFWKNSCGKPVELTWHEENGEALYLEHVPYPGFDAMRVTRFTEDRNACALVLDELASREDEDLIDRFEGALFDVTSDDGHGDFHAIRISPDTICYCALKAIEDSKEDSDVD